MTDVAGSFVPESEPFIEMRDLSYAYPDGTQALSGVSCRIGRGESVAVVGGNGAGKSTLLMLLSGGHAATGGFLAIGGMRVGKSTLDAARRTVGMVFQDSDDQLFMPTVWDDVAFGPQNRGCGEGEVEAVVEAALREVGMEALAKKAPYRLSCGEKRLVAIATILAMRPGVIVMDEPTSNLDPRARRAFISTVNRLAPARIIASHDLEMALETCSRTLVMAGGRLVADGPTGEILADDRILEQGRLEKPLSLRRSSSSRKNV